jgi:hypothetical protein
LLLQYSMKINEINTNDVKNEMEMEGLRKEIKRLLSLVRLMKLFNGQFLKEILLYSYSYRNTHSFPLKWSQRRLIRPNWILTEGLSLCLEEDNMLPYLSIGCRL